MRKFEKAKGFIVGFLTCALISMSFVNGFAESITKQLNAVYSDIKLVVNGQTVTPKDSNGKVVEPFIVDGTTYLPVRAISQALGQAVKWDGKTSTIYIGANEEIGQPTIWLKDMNPMVGKMNSYKPEIIDNLGKSYNNYVEVSGSSITFPLNNQYSKFTGTFVLTERAKDTYTSQRFKVYLDDELFYTSDDLTAGSFPIDFEIDIKGALKMRIDLEWDYDSSAYGKGHTPGTYYPILASDYVGFVNAGLWE